MDETQAVINRGNENSINRWSLFSLMIHGLLFDFILIPAFKRKERNNYAGNLGDEIQELEKDEGKVWASQHMAHNKMSSEHLLKERRKGAQGLIVRPLASS